MDRGGRQEDVRDREHCLAWRVATVRHHGHWRAMRKPEASGNPSGLMVLMGGR